MPEIKPYLEYPVAKAPMFRPPLTAEDLQRQQNAPSLGGAFVRTTPAYGLYSGLTRPDFEPEVNFDWEKTIPKDPLFARFPDAFFGVRSWKEYEFVRNKLQSEIADRKAFEDAGLPGLVLGFAAGLVSPTIFLPVGKALEGAGAVRTALVAASAASADEIFLHMGQISRTQEETAYSIAGSAILGGILGGAVKALSQKAGDNLLRDIMELNRGEETSADLILPNGQRVRGLSAQIAPMVLEGADPGKPAPAFSFNIGKYQVNLDKPLWKIFPSTRVLSQDVSPTARWMQAQLTTGGLRTEAHLEGKVTAPFGEAENLVKRYWGNLAQVMRETKTIYREYVQEHGKDALSRRDFDQQVGYALRRAGRVPDKHVLKAAEIYRKNLFLPLLVEARRLGIEGFDKISDQEAMRYLPRIIKDGLAIAEQDTFKETLRLLVMDELKDFMGKSFVRFYNQTQKERELLTLIRSPERVSDKLSEVRAQFKKVEELIAKEREIIENRRQLIKELRERVKEEAVAGNLKEANRLAKKAKELAAKNRRTGRLRSLTANQRKIQDTLEILLLLNGDPKVAQELTTQAAKLRVKALRLYSDLGARLKAFTEAMEGVPPKEVAAQLDKLLGRYENNLKRLTNAAKKLDDEELRKTLTNLKRIRSELEKIREELLRGDLNEAQTKLLQLAEKVATEQRAEIDRILAKAGAMESKATISTPEGRRALEAEAQSKLQEKYTKFEDTLRKNRILPKDTAYPLQAVLKGETISPGHFDLDRAAKEIATDVFNKYLGLGGHLPALSLLSERSPMHARVFRVDETKVVANGRKLEDFLESDIEKVSRRYIRMMGPDLTLHKIFGRVNPLAPDSPYLQKIVEEFRARAKAIEEKYKDDKNAPSLKKQKEIQRNELLLRRTLNDLEGQIERLRHIRGAPKDPHNGFFRFGKALLNHNVTTMMGGVAISSIPDLARLTMKQVLTGSLRVPFKQFLEDTTEALQALKEGQLSGTANDVMLHGRASAVFDIYDDIELPTKAERALDAMAQNMGRIALFDYWNTLVKTDASYTALAMLRQGAEDLAAGKANKATRAWLAQHGVDEELASRIRIYSKKYQPEQLKHIISPEHWLEKKRAELREARLARVSNPTVESIEKLDQVRFEYNKMLTDVERLRAAVAKFVDDSIVTPGIDRPLFADANIWGRIFMQFKSFTLDSTKRVVMAAMQDARMGAYGPVMIGVLSAMAWGVISYLAWASLRGGRSWERAKERVEKGEWDEIILEGFSRSGLFGVFEEARALAEKVPALRPVATFGADTTTERRLLFGPLDSALGVSYSTLQKASRVVSQVDQSPGDAMATAVKLIPGNNLIGISWAFRRLEDILRGDAK